MLPEDGKRCGQRRNGAAESIREDGKRMGEKKAKAGAAFPWPVGETELNEACAEYLEGLGNEYDPGIRRLAAQQMARRVAPSLASMAAGGAPEAAYQVRTERQVAMSVPLCVEVAEGNGAEVLAKIAADAEGVAAVLAARAAQS